MKVVINKIFVFIALFFGAFFAVAGNPPVPNITGRKKPPPPPGLPIDENIFLLMIIAVLFGIYIIYSHRLKTKAPM